MQQTELQCSRVDAVSWRFEKPMWKSDGDAGLDGLPYYEFSDAFNGLSLVFSHLLSAISIDK
jgi:hypothetical protein